MRHLFILTALLLASQSVARAADGLFVYPPVSGLAASEHYRVRVRSASDGSKWQSAFAWETVCKTVDKKTDAYFDTLAGWTHAYVSKPAPLTKPNIVFILADDKYHCDPTACAWEAKKTYKSATKC